MKAATSLAVMMAAFRAAPISVLVTAMNDGTVLAANPRFLEFAGYTEDEVLGRSVEELGIWADIQDRQRLIGGMKCGDVAEVGVKALHRKDGACIHTELVFTRVDTMEGEMIVAMSYDVSVSTWKERSYRKMSSMAATFGAHFPVDFWSCDGEGYIIFQSAKNEAAFGHAIGLRVDDLPLPEPAKADLWRMIQGALAGQVVTDERMHGSIDAPCWSLDMAAPILEEEEIQGVMALSLDITEKKRAEREAAEARDVLQASERLRMLGAMAGGIAHDFNNVLTGLVMTLDLVRESVADGPSDRLVKRRLGEALKMCDGAHALVQQLLHFAGRHPYRLGLLDPATALNGQIPLLKALIPVGSGVELFHQIEPGLPLIMADPTWLSRIVMNLVANAKDAMPDGGRILVAAKHVQAPVAPGLRGDPAPKPGDYLLLEVSDQGMGMDEETKLRIFEPFFTTKGPGRGTGLGLSVLFGIVEQARGTVGVESRLGSGTTFRVYLPTADTLARWDAELGSAPVAG